MALIKCQECQKEISSMADFCPNCGFKPNKNNNINLSMSNYSSKSNIEEGKELYKDFIYSKTQAESEMAMQGCITIFPSVLVGAILWTITGNMLVGFVVTIVLMIFIAMKTDKRIGQ